MSAQAGVSASLHNYTTLCSTAVNSSLICDHTSALPLPCWSSTGFARVTEGVFVHVVVSMEARYRAHPDLADTTGIQSIDSVCVNCTL